MNKKQLRTVLQLLEKASKVHKKKRREYIKSCSNDEIHAICGATKNLIDGNFEMSKGKKAYLKNTTCITYAVEVNYVINAEKVGESI